MEGREARGVGSGGDIRPSRVTSGARDRGVGDGGNGGERCTFVLYRRKDGKLQNGQETGRQEHCDWDEVVLSS